MIYLYGILPTPVAQTLDLQGLDQQPVQVQTVDQFTFLYSEAKQKRYLTSRRNLLNHEQVLEGAMEQGYRTLLPLQFGLVIQDWQTVRQQLVDPQGETLHRLFEKLQGHREVSIKLLWDQQAELEALMQENADLKTERDRLEGKSLSMDAVVRVGQAIERALTQRKEAIVQQFQTVLQGLAVEWVENKPLTEDMVYNAAYLILWETEPQFSEAVETLDRQFEGRLRIRYNHFTAPFNFTQLN